jgi:hypothetical protein
MHDQLLRQQYNSVALLKYDNSLFYCLCHNLQVLPGKKSWVGVVRVLAFRAFLDQRGAGAGRKALCITGAFLLTIFSSHAQSIMV